MSDSEGVHVRVGGVQSVDRALALLESLAASSGPVGVTDLSRRLDLAPGTVHRLLLALADRGYVRRDEGRKYGIGIMAVRLGDAAYRELGLTARSHLDRVVSACGESANLALLEGSHMVYAAQSPSPHTLRIFAEVGRRVPVHCTAVGKAVLGLLPEHEARELLGGGPFEARTPHSLTTTDAVLQAAHRATDEGYALDDEEQELGVRCVAVPLPEQGDGGLLAALSVSAPSERLSVEQAVALVPVLRDAARTLASSAFGN